MEKNNNFDDDWIFEYIGKVKLKKKVIEVKNGFLYLRNKVVLKNVLNKVGYRCEVDNDYLIFRRWNLFLYYIEFYYIVFMFR